LLIHTSTVDQAQMRTGSRDETDHHAFDMLQLFLMC